MSLSAFVNIAKNTTPSFSHEKFLKALLKERGFNSLEEAETFLYPSYDKHLHDPFLLPDMEKSVARMLQAIQNGEKILIYTDYDTDGTPAAVMFYDFFKAISFKNFENYIPHRHNEGYGLNREAIEEFGKREVKLLVTADCGITDSAEVARANELGITVIITDHHLPSSQLPPAYAVINPKRSDSAYPFDGLCGAGVAFKFITALIAEGKKKKFFEIPEGWEKWLLDMVGLATIADMVPLVDENRVLAHYGLKVLRKTRRPGLRSLLMKLRINPQEITEEDVGFSIGPRINAASRMDNPLKAFELLATPDYSIASRLAEELDELNKKRKGVVAGMVRSAKKRLAGSPPKEVIVIGSLEWHPGVLGLAANALVEEYDKPAFVWGSLDGRDIKGSARSDGRINIVELMREAKDSFLDFGGHAHSGGFSLSRGALHALEERLLSAFPRISKIEITEKKSYPEIALLLQNVNWDTYKIIEEFSPFGIGNPKPVFVFPALYLKGSELFGAQQNHIRVRVSDGAGDSAEAIQFFPTFSFKEQLNNIALGSQIDLFAHIEKSVFRGRKELRLRIVDLKLVE